MRRGVSRVLIISALIVTLLSLEGVAEGGLCALCRQALESGGSAGLLKGFYWSTILIGSVPLVIMGVASFSVWRACRIRRASERRTRS